MNTSFWLFVFIGATFLIVSIWNRIDLNKVRKNFGQQPGSTITDAEAHYKSLVDLFERMFKYSLAILGVAAAIVTGLTYQNGQQMRKEVQDERAILHSEMTELRQEISLQRKELTEQGKDMRRQVTEEILISRDEVKKVEERAVGQIGSIREVATTEARNKIEEILRGKNIKQVVDDVIESRMRPEFVSLVDERIGSKIDSAINLLNSKSNLQQNRGFSYLISNTTNDLSEKQAQRLIEIAKTSKDVRRDMAISILQTRHMNVILEYFKDLLLSNEDPCQSDAIDAVLTYILAYDDNIDMAYLRKLCEYAKNKQCLYNRYVQLTALENEIQLPKILNDTYLVQTVLNSITTAEGKQLFKEQITSLIPGLLSASRDYYFFNYK